MKQEDHDEISKLLRLKRFEQPPPEYFENFLQEFHHRQRAQMLREPVWRIAVDRLWAFFGEQMPGRIGYGLASTAVLVAAAITSFHILETQPVAGVAVSAPGPAPAAQTASLNFDTQVQLPDLPPVNHTATFSQPRYVMDTRPVSYDVPTSF
jgi:hypothetical protein